MDFIIENFAIFGQIYLTLVGAASAIVQLIPVLPENHPALPYLKFLAKFVALNRREIKPEDRPNIDSK